MTFEAGTSARPSRLRRRAGQDAAHWVAQGCIPRDTIAQTIARKVAEAPEVRLVFSRGEQRTEATTGAVYAAAGRLCAALAERGVGTGDCVAVQLPPTLEHMTILLACIRGGFVYVPILPTYGIAESRFILDRTRARTLFLPCRFHKTDYRDRPELLSGLPDLSSIVFVGDEDLPPGGTRYADLAPAGPTELPDRPLEQDDVAAIIFTSGTTAEPKGVLHSDGSLHAYCEVAAHYGPPRPTGANLVALPGIGGLAYMLRPFLHGEGAIFLDQWSGAVAVSLVRDYGAWWTGGAPFFLRSIIDAASDRSDYASLVHCLVGGANVPPALIEEADGLGICAVRSYGSSEHPVASCGMAGDGLADRALTDGVVMPGTRLRIVDDDEQDLPEGQPGEIVTAGPQLFGGYLDQQLDAGAFTRDGWFRTGDIGVLRGGRLTVVDRKKDMIIRGGQNISSKEVEDILSRHPEVLEAAAIGWPDAVYGERVGVFVRTAGGVELSIEEVARHFQEQGAARFKTPERIRVVDEFSRNASGKVLKNVLRELAKEQQQQ